MIDSSKLKRIEDCKGRLKELVGNEGVLKLARDGVCPHYIITNPLTQEESFWFIPSEINEWFENNYIKYEEGYFTQNYRFLYFDRDKFKANNDIPPQLTCISDLYKLPIENCPLIPGIYFLCLNNEIMYIGKSENIHARINTHIKECVKEFDSIYFIRCEISRLSEIETSLIKYYDPPLNRTSNGKIEDKHHLIIKSLSV